ncbi:hypothetical protein [Vreelandella aquamarina]|uniref:hypothetical protein n=1 Tax=Vreelandella aquamarina TaxID=77097 RepID=UPI00384EABA3
MAGSGASAATSANLDTALSAATSALGGEVSALGAAASTAAFVSASNNVREGYIADAEAAAASAVTSAEETLESTEADAGSDLLSALDTVESRTASYEAAIAAAEEASTDLVGAVAAFDNANAASDFSASVSGTEAFAQGTVSAGGTFSAASGGDVFAVYGSTSGNVVLAQVNSAGDWELTSAGENADLARTTQLLSALQSDTDARDAQSEALGNLQDAVQNVVRIDQEDNTLEIDWSAATSIITNSGDDVTVDFTYSASAGDWATPSTSGPTGAIASDAATVLSARTALETALEDQSDLADALADYREMTQLESDYDDLVEAETNAELAITNEEDDDPAGLGISLLEDGEDFTAGDDVYLFAEADNDVSMSDFGADGEDQIFFGEGFTLVELEDGQSMSQNVGDASALEIFWEQDGDDLQLYVESETFGGNSTGDAEITQVTLVGFNADDITGFEGGFLTAGTAA